VREVALLVELQHRFHGCKRLIWAFQSHLEFHLCRKAAPERIWLQTEATVAAGHEDAVEEARGCVVDEYEVARLDSRDRGFLTRRQAADALLEALALRRVIYEEYHAARRSHRTPFSELIGHTRRLPFFVRR
jgi:hypothetical protein